MLLRMFGEEERVAIVRNDSNDKPTPYISSKKPSTLPTEWRTDHQQTHHHPTFPSEAQPHFQQ